MKHAHPTARIRLLTPAEHAGDSQRHSDATLTIGNDEELDISGIREDVASGRLVVDPFERGNLVEQWLAMGIVRWMQVRSVAPNGPRNIWAPHDPDKPVAALPRFFSRPIPSCRTSSSSKMSRRRASCTAWGVGGI